MPPSAPSAPPAESKPCVLHMRPLQRQLDGTYEGSKFISCQISMCKDIWSRRASHEHHQELPWGPMFSQQRDTYVQGWCPFQFFANWPRWGVGSGIPIPDQLAAKSPPLSSTLIGHNLLKYPLHIKQLRLHIALMPSYVRHFYLPSPRNVVCLVVGLSVSYVWHFCLSSPWFYCLSNQ